MLKSYLVTAWRSFVRNKTYSLFNVLGLALGICACLVIYLITRYEFSFDNFHPDRADRPADRQPAGLVPYAWLAAGLCLPHSA